MYKFIILLFLASCGSQPLGPYLGKPELFGEVKIVHHYQPWMDWMLKDDRKDWMGNNPRIHFRVGWEWEHKIDCPVLSTGTSLFVGAPLAENAPELYWAHFECGKRWGGK